MERHTMKYLRVAAVLAGIIAATAGYATPAAQAAGDVPFCQVSLLHRAPESGMADYCREHGWTVRPRLVVGPHGVVRYSALPHCRYEDGSGQRAACSWNFTPSSNPDGNGRGLAYWVDRHDQTHYVWPQHAPSHWSGWLWVNAEVADALAEGTGRHDGTRNWEQ